MSRSRRERWTGCARPPASCTVPGRDSTQTVGGEGALLDELHGAARIVVARRGADEEVWRALYGRDEARAAAHREKIAGARLGMSGVAAGRTISAAAAATSVSAFSASIGKLKRTDCAAVQVLRYRRAVLLSRERRTARGTAARPKAGRKAFPRRGCRGCSTPRGADASEGPTPRGGGDASGDRDKTRADIACATSTLSAGGAPARYTP